MFYYEKNIFTRRNNMKKGIGIILVALLLSGVLTGCYGFGIDSFGNQEALPTGEIDDFPNAYPTVSYPDDFPFDESIPKEEETPAEVYVRPAEWANVQWEPYTSTYFTIYIPSGWQVQWDSNAQNLWWTVTSPDGKIGIHNLDHDYAAKDPAMTQTLGFQKAMYNASVQGYFEMIYEDNADYFAVQNSCVPENYSILQSSTNKQIKDYQALYATFRDSTVGEGEGVYSAVLFDHDDIYIRGANYANWEIDAILTQWAPLGQFVNWQSVLAQIAQSFAYTDYYIQEWQSWMNTSINPSSSVNDTDPVMEAFEERSKSDTIIQEKRSDMLEEYERVYDNSTGEIYRAYNGFLDDIGDQNRYTPITDSQYADGYVGWIDK